MHIACCCVGLVGRVDKIAEAEGIKSIGCTGMLTEPVRKVLVAVAVVLLCNGLLVGEVPTNDAMREMCVACVLLC
jgi:hypothetical protein